MKKIAKWLITCFCGLLLLSCDIDAPRPYSGPVTVVLADIPDGIGAVSIWCNANNWKTSEVTAENGYVVKVEDGKAKFEFANYILSTPLSFQFTPMKTIDTKLNDDWWSCAISGSSQYAKQKNNMVCDFVAKGLNAGCTITVTKAKHKGAGWSSSFPCYPDNPARKHTENFTDCFEYKN